MVKNSIECFLFSCISMSVEGQEPCEANMRMIKAKAISK